MIGRRQFLRGLISTLAAPAIVRIASLMPVRVMPPVEELDSWQEIAELFSECNDYLEEIESAHEFRIASVYMPISVPAGVWRSINMSEGV